MNSYAIGLDYGTNSCRALLLDLTDGRELGAAVFPYPSGDAGILLDPHDPNFARQHPRDYIDGLVAAISGAVTQAKKKDPNFKVDKVIGIGVDTTGSTPIPVDADGMPLGLKREFAGNLYAMAWLWKDHTGHEEAARITEAASRLRPQYLAKCGGTYSSEWWWSKIWRLKNVAPDVFEAAYSFVEHCDYIPALLTANTKPRSIKRSVCAAGHKAMFNAAWGGLPDKAFLAELDPALADLRDRLYDDAVPADQLAGGLADRWASKLGLTPGTAVAVGSFDAHMGAVGCGIKEGVLVKILGTSTCDLMVVPNTGKLPDIPGVCGIVDGSVLPGHFGIEAGQSAVGDLFLWFLNHLVPESYGTTVDAKFATMEALNSKMKPGESGLLALDWNNGNRTILVDVRLSGLLLGQTLHTEAHEIFRALIEATAFGALTIIERIEEYGVPVREVINTGGLAVKSPALMQIYADILGRPLKVAASDQTCALGAALFGAAASGRISLEEARENCCGVRERVYEPNPADQAVYAELYALYRRLHDGFGLIEGKHEFGTVMKELLSIRERARCRQND